MRTTSYSTDLTDPEWAVLRALVASGEIGGLTQTHYSCMGFIPDWRIVLDTMAPTLALQVAAQQPDAVLLVPV